MRTSPVLWFSLFFLLGNDPFGAVAIDCSRSLPSPTNNGGGSFTGGVQLLIPSWTFSCPGFIDDWFAHVTGDTSVTVGSGIEFQVLKPDPVKSNAYNLIYGNMYGDDIAGGLSADGSRIRFDVNIGYLLPVRPGYIVGVYIDPNAVNQLSLIYDNTAEDIDIYYWENLTGRMCDLSLCDAKVTRGSPLIGWTFRNVTSDNALSTQENTIQALRMNLQYCNETEALSCVPPSESVEPTMSSTLMPPSLSSVTSSATPSSSSTDGSGSGNGGGGIFEDLSIQVVAVLGVIVILLLLVIILSLIICICCLCRSKTGIEVSGSVENPGYDDPGTISTISKSHLLSSSPQTSLPSIPVAMTTHHTYIEESLRDSNIVDTRFTSAGAQDLKNLRGGEKNGGIPTNPLPIGNGGFINNDYDDPEPSQSIVSPQSQNGLSHYYSTPNAGGDVDPISPPVGPYYSLPPAEAVPNIIEIYDTPDCDSVVPSSNDPEVTDNYDKIIIKDKSPPGEPAPSNNGDPTIYNYVPTLEQRTTLLNWRYEIPADQEYDKLNFFVQTKVFWKPAATTTGLYEQLASNKYREINRKEIAISSTLGEGQFGYVSKGLWTHANERHDVAVKMLKPDATDQDRVKLLQEAAIMGQFTHKNIVKLHGVVTVGEPVMMLLEFMPRGELRAYLRSIKSKLSASNITNMPKLLLRFCRDISSGMAYLSQKSFVHRDLAARNVLLASDLTCKIGDFGMARDLMEDESNYYKSSGGIIPLKWTAPEALNFKKYTSASDVWSYGMVLYEIWSLGHKPFNDLSNPIVIALVNSKHCQAPPPGCSRRVYQLMVNCWNPEHTLRPKFESISEYLKDSDESLLQWSREDLSAGKDVSRLGAPLEVSTDLYVDLQRTYQAAMLEQSNKNFA
ncbi:PREDICTED: uncharacterized protein LOC109580485 isoform X2 [Amphimedon queenslandica]|uniref:Protein kinase domain-containing protein n=1 Tax=Amphimedon queenslandica TaxID=400682 RepID=A0AAN0IXV7_AMPQE|nr:PREDICTED: uncharacterized protein LOC109580485 isoform X2 [Amphimedon queenslandica]|eukprot:XP_019849278.1 PREDICTED: uncharacterized protein LOC109580485 isoform X2 [Amphimedon queenslandica]